MISAFNKQNLQQLRVDMNVALAQVAAKHGIQIVLKNISFLSERASVKVELIALGSNAGVTGKSAEEVVREADFKRYCSSFGLKPEQFGVQFKHGRDTYKLAGLKPRAPKRPILATNVADGRTYILPESAIAPLQSKEHRELFGIPIKTVDGVCSNDRAYDEKFNPIGKCPRKPTAWRKNGKHAPSLPYCDQCARLIDESRREMEAEARCS